MKKSTKIIAGVCVAAVAIAAAVLTPKIKHYFFHDDYVSSLEKAEYTPPEGQEFVPLAEDQTEVPGYQAAAENEILKLYVDPETTQIAVLDKRNGKVVYSNPQEKDSIAVSVNAEELNSQLIVQYYNEKRTAMSMNNYTMSIENGQFELQSIPDGVRILYTLGDLSSKTGTVPVYITEERLQTLVLDKLPEDEAKTVKSSYMPSSTYEGYLELASGVMNSKLTLNRFQGYFDEAGYTQEDFLQDMAISEEGEEKITFTIVVDYRLDGEELLAEIPASMIEETGGGKIGSISFLKYFGSAGLEEEGYMLVPNGSGALIYFNNGNKQESYSQAIYGTDPAAANYIQLEQSEKARLPIFGIKREDSAVFARIENGDAFATISAEVSGKLNAQNYVYPTFLLRPSELLSMFGTTGGEADLPLVEDALYDGVLRVRYAFLTEEDADYSGMAAYLRDQLTQEGVLTKQEPEEELPMYLDMVGGVQMKKFFIGVPYLTDFAMTTFEEAETIAERFHNEGITALKLNYLGWFNGGYYHDMPDNVNVLSKLGGKKGLEQLTEMIESAGGEVFAEVAFQRVSEEAGGFAPMFEAGRYYSGIYLEFGQINPATVRQTSSLGYPETLYYCMSPRYLGYYAQHFADEISDIAVTGISLRDLADNLQSDKNNSESVNREAAKYVVKDAFQALEDTERKIMVSGGDYYSLAYADDIINAPISANSYFIIDEEIPFYEMVIHGYIDYACSAINLADYSDYDMLILNLIETGAAPHFTLSYEDASEMKYSGLNKIYTSDEDYWFEDAVEIYGEVNEALAGVSGQTMVSHEILDEGVRKVTYENGVVFYINRSAASVTVEGVEIGAYSYEKR